MAEDRVIVESQEDARAELGEVLARPIWREGRHQLPFTELTDDEFEVFCFKLLKREHPDDRIYYYGKTKDLGRDIVHEHADGTHTIIECKRYADRVGIGDVRAELAKLATNIHNGSIKKSPTVVAWYVVPDLSSPAADLLDNQGRWKEVAASVLKRHLAKEPGKELLDSRYLGGQTSIESMACR